MCSMDDHQDQVLKHAPIYTRQGLPPTHSIEKPAKQDPIEALF